jgi:hypothetical protein
MKNDIYSLKAGDKIRYKGTGPFWFNDMIRNAKALTKGKIYTVTSKKVFSSWVLITLKETGGEIEYALHWFDIL